MSQKSIVEEFGEQARAFFSKLTNHFKSENLVCKVYMGSKELFQISNLNYKISQNEISIFIKITKEMMSEVVLEYLNTNKAPYINRIEFYDGDVFVVSKDFTGPEYLAEQKEDLTITYNLDFNYPQLFS